MESQDRSIEELARLLETADPEGRLKAVEELGEMGEEGDAVRICFELTKALRDWYSPVREAAVGYLGMLGDRTTVGPVIEMLADEDEEVWLAAMEALRKLEAAAIEPLIGMLESGDRELRARAASTLGHIGDRSAVPHLGRRLRDSDPRTRGLAARALGECKATEYVDEVLALVSDADPFVRARAIEALGMLGEKRVTTAIEAALANKGGWPEVRLAAAKALGELGDKGSEDVLLAVIADPSDSVRASAAKALGQMRAARAVDTLISMLRDEDPALRWQAAVALGKIGDPAALPALKEVREHDKGVAFPLERNVAEAADQAIERISGPVRPRY